MNRNPMFPFSKSSIMRLSAFSSLFLGACIALIGTGKLAAGPTDAVYKDTNAPMEGRVDDIFSKLTQEEKLSMLSGDSPRVFLPKKGIYTSVPLPGNGFLSKALPRLDLPAMQMCDGAQGVFSTKENPSTAFPAGVTMASSWDRDLVRAIGQAIGEEAKNKGSGMQILLGPAVNIHRSPLNGRESEYMSEDPYLAARLVVQYIEGMQSTGVAACVKHFACNNQEIDRGTVNVIVDDRTLYEIYLPAFEAAVKEGHVWTIMAAYNKVNGPWCTANKPLLTDILRKDWGFNGLTMSDWGAVHEVDGVVHAGTDLEMPGGDFLISDKLKKSLTDGTIKQSEIDRAVRNILRAMVRTHLADRVRTSPDHSNIGSQEHQAVALRGGEEGMVLLKNENQQLPLDPNAKQTIALIGHRAKDWQFGALGSPQVHPTVMINPYDGITQRLTTNKECKIIYNEAKISTMVPSSVLTAADGTNPGLTGNYYYEESGIKGPSALTRVDPSIGFAWDEKTISGGTPKATNEINVEWKGTLTAPVTGEYLFGIDTARMGQLDINGTKVIFDDWTLSTGNPVYGHIQLTAGQKYPIRVRMSSKVNEHPRFHLTWCPPGNQPFKEAADTAKKADVAIVFAGTGREGEAHDRSTMELVEDQAELITEVVAANPHTIVVLNTGSPILTGNWLNSVPTVLNEGFPGELGGKALAEILFGDVSPSGKLVDTYGVRREDYPDYGNYPGKNQNVEYKEGIYVGYRAFDKRAIAPQFPFGYGLSYTQFKYSNLEIPSETWHPRGELVVKASITNSGQRKGSEIAELYIEPVSPGIDRPIRELKGFARVDLAPGETKEVTFKLTPQDFAYCDVPGKQWKADAGKYLIEVGSSSRDLILKYPITLTDGWTEPIPSIGILGGGSK